MDSDPTDQMTWGQVEPTAFDRIVVVSPHFDDAAMGAGHLIASYEHVTVVTVCGGRPTEYPEEPTEWDAMGGFRAGDDVVAIRREEDRDAMAVLGADPVWLDFVDHQYLEPDRRPAAVDLAPELERAITGPRPTAVFVPMGLGNPDHVLTHDAALLVRERLGGDGDGPVWFCYEDQGYKHIPGLLSWRVAKLLREGPWATPAIVPHQPDMARKREAVWCYRSQIGPLEQEHALSARMDGNVPEQFWRLAPAPRGWEGLADLT